jgi:hypothetical protein
MARQRAVRTAVLSGADAWESLMELVMHVVRRPRHDDVIPVR